MRWEKGRTQKYETLAPDKSRPGVSEYEGTFWLAIGATKPPKRPALQRSHAEAFSLPRLAWLGSAPDRPLLGIFKSSSGTLGIWNGRHEAHSTPSRVDRDSCLAATRTAAPVACSADRSADANGPMDCADPFVHGGGQVRTLGQ
jgi:hypothetical protein